MEHLQPAIDSDFILSKIKQKIENHHADKFTYALPEWAMFTGDPKIIALLTIHGEEGLRIAKQRVDFEVDFYAAASVLYYVDFLKDQMNQQLDSIGYVFFYDANLVLVKDPNYSDALTPFQEDELQTYNKNMDRASISLLMVDKNLKEVSVLDQMVELS